MLMISLPPVDLSLLAWLLRAVSTTLILTSYSNLRTRTDPVADLTLRIRRPIRWTLEHPIRALKRRV